MKIVRVRSMGLTVPVPHFDTLAEAIAHVKGNEMTAVDLLNKYGRQKDSLVDAREYVSEQLVALGFPLLTKEEKDGDKMVTVPAETDNKHIDRFIAAAVGGKVNVKGLTVTGKDEEEKANSVKTFLQGIIDNHGPFEFDLNRTTRKGKAKNPPPYAVNAATAIINNGAKSVAKWVTNFTEGYESKGYGEVEPVEFQPFDVAPAKHADAAMVETIRQQNITNLAWAIHAVEEQKKAKNAQREYV